jgi:hypothetical protein
VVAKIRLVAFYYNSSLIEGFEVVVKVIKLLLVALLQNIIFNKKL